VPGLSVANGIDMPQQVDRVQAAAHYVVSGTVLVAEERVRLHAYLNDGRTGQTLWSERFDRSLNDLFAVQEELGPKILHVLPTIINEVELQRVARRYTRSLAAYEFFLRGQAALQLRQREENDTARELFRQAIEQDAAFARAYATLALTYCADYRNQWTQDGSGALDRAMELVKTASEIDPDIPEIYWVQAFVQMERRQNDKALQLLETAVRLFPSYADGYALLGSITTYLGQPAESVRQLHTAMRLNPQAHQLYYLNLGRAYLFLGDLEQARFNLAQAKASNPENLETNIYLAVLNVLANDLEAAEWNANEILLLEPRFTSRGWIKTYPMTDTTQKDLLVKELSKLGL